jgi:hypothetical protein
MATVYIFGAGASYAYTTSPVGVQPPLARGFFQTYKALSISEDFEVRVGDIVNYVRDYYSIAPTDFDSFDADAEQFMTRLDSRLREHAAKLSNKNMKAEEWANLVVLVKAYDQMIFLFAHILNEIQNGPLCRQYAQLVAQCSPLDTLVTFNWDTLLDQAIFADPRWFPDTGYGVIFRSILDEDWREPCSQESELTYLKLHGSTNWLVNYITYDLQTGERIMITPRPRPGFASIAADFNLRRRLNGEVTIRPEVHEVHRGSSPPPRPGEPEAQPCCFVQAAKPFRTYADRYRDGYGLFSYFFPPNEPEHDVPLMPLIVPPTKIKFYDEFAHILDPLWEAAVDACIRADKIVIIGYSLPQTDERARQLLRSAMKAGDPEIRIVNPNPEPVITQLTDELGFNRHKVIAIAETFDEYLDLE